MLNKEDVKYAILVIFSECEEQSRDMSGKRVEVINQKRKTKMIRRKFKGRIFKSDFQVLVKADSRL